MRCRGSWRADPGARIRDAAGRLSLLGSAGSAAVRGSPAGALALTAAVWLAGCTSGSASQEVDAQTLLPCESAEMVAVLDPALMEVSGMARDPRRPDLFWMHNDSGNETVLFAVDSLGRLLAAADVSGATDRDIEDLSIGRCGSEWCAYLGDIGDNLGRHRSVFIHRVPLPAVADVPGPDGTVERLEELTATGSWEFVFPDGPRDAEGLLVDVERGELGIVSKGREGAVVLYGVRLVDLEGEPGGVHSLTRIGRLSVPIGEHSTQMVTGAELSPDRSWLALRTYASLYLLRWSGVFEQDTLRAPLSVSLIGALEPQGEGVAWSSDGETLWLSSEGRGGRPPQLSRIRCPASSRQVRD